MKAIPSLFTLLAGLALAATTHAQDSDCCVDFSCTCAQPTVADCDLHPDKCLPKPASPKTKRDHDPVGSGEEAGGR